MAKKRIELVNEVVKAIEFCPFGEDFSDERAKLCMNCVLMGACLEYWTGDDTENQDED